MSPAARLLGSLRARGILISLTGADTLRARGPLTSADRDQLVAAKPAVIAELTREAAAGLLPCGHRLGPGEDRWAHEIRDAVMAGDDLAVAWLQREPRGANPVHLSNPQSKKE